MKGNENLSTKEYLALQNNNLEAEIEDINNKIKENLEKQKLIRYDNSDNTVDHKNMDEKNEELYIIQQKIAFYKDAIQKQKSQMDKLFNVKKIENLENNLKNKKENLQKVKNEFSTLNNIYKSEIKAKNKLMNVGENEVEKESFFQKMKALKDELMDQKELNKNIEIKVKEQHNLIRIVEEKCKKIKEKIENLKNKPKQDVYIPTEEEIFGLEDKILQTENNIKLEEKYYKQEINNQKEKIEILNQKIIELTKNIKSKGRDILLNEKKVKKKEQIVEKAYTNEKYQLKNSNSNKKLTPLNPNKKEEMKNRSLSAKDQINKNEIILPKVNKKLNKLTPLNLNKSKNFETEPK